jgi:hypothetical protein
MQTRQSLIISMGRNCENENASNTTTEQVRVAGKSHSYFLEVTGLNLGCITGSTEISPNFLQFLEINSFL